MIHRLHCRSAVSQLPTVGWAESDGSPGQGDTAVIPGARPVCADACTDAGGKGGPGAGETRGHFLGLLLTQKESRS